MWIRSKFFFLPLSALPRQASGSISNSKEKLLHQLCRNMTMIILRFLAFVCLIDFSFSRQPLTQGHRQPVHLMRSAEILTGLMICSRVLNPNSLF